MKRNICFRTMMSMLTVLVVVITAISCESREVKQVRPHINTYEDAVNRFNEIFKSEPVWVKPFEVYPDNRLYVDTRKSEMCFITGPETLKWKYSGAFFSNDQQWTEDYNCKIVDPSSVTDFKRWMNGYLGINENCFKTLTEQIKTDYNEKINETQASLEDHDKAFSLIYNYLVGDPDGYISAYVKDSKLNKIGYSDFPSIELDTTSFIKAVSELDSLVANSSTKAQIKASDYLKFNEVEKPNFGYHNYRQDLYFAQFQSGSATKKFNKKENKREVSQEFFDTILNNPEKVYEVTKSWGLDVLKPKTYYVVDEASLSELVFNIDPKPDWRGLALWGCTFAAICCAGVLIYIFWGRISVKMVEICARIQERKAIPPEERQSEKQTKNKSKSQSKHKAQQLAAKKTKPEKQLEQQPEKQQDDVAFFIEKLKKIAGSEQPSAENVLKEFDRHFKTETKKTFLDILDEKNKLKSKADELDSFKKKIKESQLSVKTLLHEVDLLLEVEEGYEALYDAEVAEAGDYSTTYSNFIHLKTEKDVMDHLDSIRKNNDSFPEIKTVSKLLRKSKKSSSDTLTQISAFLKDADPSLHSEFQLQVRDAESYARIGKMFREENIGMEYDRYLQNLVDNALAMDELVDVDKYIDFALNFKASDKTADVQFVSVADAARQRYNDIDRALENLSDTSKEFMAKDTLNFWDRLSYFLLLATTSKPLYKADGADYDDKISVAVEAFKNDILYLYMTRNLLSVVNEESAGPDYFEQEILRGRVAAKVQEYNNVCADDARLNMEDYAIDACIELCVEAIRKIRREEHMTEIFTRMWNKFVQEFTDKVSTNADKGWVSGNSVQIALYLSDILKHLIAGNGDCYCRNYTYLMTGMMTEADTEFVMDDYRYSDKYSNFIYKFLKECGVTDIDMIVNNFRIKM